MVFARIGTSTGLGLITGGMSGVAGNLVRGLDLAGNLTNLGRGVIDVYNNGLNLGNATTIVASSFGLFGNLSRGKVTPNGAGALTSAERAEIQAIADKYNTTIDVVGSRAAGKGRNIETNFPVGKTPRATTRSDIDFRIDTTHPQVDDLISDLKKVGNGAGSAGKQWSTAERATVPPVIRFTPNPK